MAYSLTRVLALLQRENLQLVQQGGAQLAAPQSRRQLSAISPSTSVSSQKSTKSLWQKTAARDDATDDFAVFEDDTGVDDGFGRDFSIEVEDFQSELDAAVRRRSLHTR